MRKPTKAWSDKLASRRGTPIIGVTLSGFAQITGRPTDRVRIASKTRDPAIFERRKQLLHWLAEHQHEQIIVALIDRRTTWRVIELAQAKGVSALRKLVQQNATPPLSAAVADYLEGYRRKGWNDTRAHLYAFDRWARVTLKREPVVADLTTTNVLTFLQKAQRRDNKASKEGVLMPSTLNRYRTSLSGFAAWCISHGYLQEHPIGNRRVKAFAESKPRMPVLRPADVRDYLTAVFAVEIRHAEAWDVRRRALALALCITTGADIGEVMRLRPSDIAWGVNAARIVFKRSKTSTRERIVPLANPVVLSELLKQMPLAQAENGNGPILTEYELYHFWPVHRKARAAIGHPELSIKDLRHVSAQMWRRAGADLQQVCEWLGHSSLEQTRIYAAFGPDEEMDTPVVRKLHALLAPERADDDVTLTPELEGIADES